jgi:ribonuclease VapC
MVIDTSAVVAILLEEPDWDVFLEAIAADPIRLLSSVNALETALVLEARKRDQGGRELDLLLHKSRINIVPFTQEHVDEARSAWEKYGKGNHRAALNICDCCAYALSKTSGEPLLFKGNDFRQTDVIPVLKQRAQPSIPKMTLVLEKTFYLQGFFNVRVDFERYFGPHDSMIEIFLEDAPTAVRGVINREAQSNRTPRIMGYKGLRDYFKTKCKQGDTVEVTIESPQRIRIRPQRAN